jgi:hypothetical protein
MAFVKAVPFPRNCSNTFDLNHLASHDEVVKEGHVGHQLDGEEGGGGLDPANGQELEDHPEYKFNFS